MILTTTARRFGSSTRRILLAVGLAVAALSLSSCIMLGENEENSLTIYTTRDRNLVESVLDEFEAAHPDYSGHIAVVYLGAQEAYERIRAEGANPQADIWWGGGQQQFERAAAGELLAAAPASVQARVPVDMRDPAGRWLGETRLAEVIAYNRDTLASAEIPKSWDDLLHKRYRGRILIRDVESSGTMRTIFAALIDREIRMGRGEDAGFRWLARLDSNTKAYAANPTDLYLRLSRGEAEITLWNLQDILLQARAKAPFAVVAPPEGVPVLIDAIAKVRGAPSPDAADAFLEFLFSETVQTRLAADYFQWPVVELSREPAWLATIPLGTMPVDWPRTNSRERAWIDRWSATVKRRGESFGE